MMASSWFYCICFLFTLYINNVYAQCPWSRNLTELHSGCSCAFNDVQQLTIQCSNINFIQMTSALHLSVSNTPIAMLYISNSTISMLPQSGFQGLKLINIQLTKCGITNIHPQAFKGQEKSLSRIGLQQNELSSIPTAALQSLSALTFLDLSKNNIEQVSSGAFAKMKLEVLKLTDNPVIMANDSLNDLRKTLHNLSLKGCRLKEIPHALKNLSALSFLDLAQNNIEELPDRALQNLSALTALNLERNPLERLSSAAFFGVEDTLSSLSLLNNGLTRFPQTALSSLTELRVLDLGFNRIRFIPDDAFASMNSLTLLALDGNPLTSIPFAPFAHLNSTLRGISLGGRSLICDCNIRWISEWIRDYDLQVTSRERSPQFCGQPESLRNANLMQLQPEKLECKDLMVSTTTTAITSSSMITVTELSSLSTINSSESETFLNESTENLEVEDDDTISAEENTTISLSLSTTASISPRQLAFLPQFETPQNLQAVQILEAYQSENTIYIKWNAKELEPSTNVRVLFRMFGDERFKISSKALSSKESEFRISNVPLNECFIVCVISVDFSIFNTNSREIEANKIPYNNCHEVRGERVETAEVDKVVIIAASAAICAAVLVAVIIFVCCHRHRLQKEQRQMPAMPPPITPLPMIEPIKLNDWDNMSVYSNRSIPRARMYYVDKSDGADNSAFLHDEGLTRFNQPSTTSKVSNGYTKCPPIMDGNQSQRSYSVMGFGTLRNGQLNHYPLGRPDLNRSTKSLAQVSHHGTMPGIYKKKSKPPRTAMSSVGSFHSLSGFESDSAGMFKPDKWNDQDMDVYMPRNTPFSQRDFR